MSKDKGTTLDGWSDHFIKEINPLKKGSLLRDLWNPEAMVLIKDCFKARLVPLNKVHPDIPKDGEFRPIIILSPLYKFLELRFLPKLQRYMSNRMDKS